MKKNKTIALILSLVISLSLLTSCQEKSTQTDNLDSNKTKKTDSIYPLKIKDSSGYELNIESKPKNIASLTLCTDEIILSIADKKNIKALSTIADDPGLSSVSEESKDIDIKLDSNSEKIIEASPDLVFVADWSDKSFIKQLRDAKINVYIYKTPSKITEVKELIQQLALIIDEKDKGIELISWMDTKLITVDEKLKTIDENSMATVLSLDGTLSAYGKDTSFDEICSKAKVKNSAAEAGIIQWQEINKEKIIDLDPDIIILPSWSYEGFDAKENSKNFKNDKSLQNILAIKNNKVFTLEDKYISSVSQNIVLGVEEVAKTAYPDLFK